MLFEDKIFVVSEGPGSRFLEAYSERVHKLEVFTHILDVSRIWAKLRLSEGFSGGFGGAKLFTVAGLVAERTLW